MTPDEFLSTEGLLNRYAARVAELESAAYQWEHGQEIDGKKIKELEARLAAVIALCDDIDNGRGKPARWVLQPSQVRAAATGEGR